MRAMDRSRAGKGTVEEGTDTCERSKASAAGDPTALSCDDGGMMGCRFKCSQGTDQILATRHVIIGAMLSVASLVAYGAPAALVEVWAKHVRDLTEVQERAVHAGALDGVTNLLVVAPTSSGKTFVGELAAAASAFTRRRHAIFIVPFKALAEEHFLLFRERYGELLSVVISTADWSEYDADIRAGNFNLTVVC
jgi:ATP-dependent helicase YprA (DUF1998 family)